MEVQLQMPPSSPPLDFDFRRGRSPPSSSAFPDRFFFLSAPTSPDRASHLYDSNEVDDFAFHVGQSIQTPSVSAEELFDSGRIRSRIAPPRAEALPPAPQSPPPPAKSTGKKSFWSAFTLRKKPSNPELERGRSRGPAQGSRARSLSPIRSSTTTTTATASKRWKLKDLLLFRSASEGRAADKDPLRNFYSRQQEIKGGSSFGSVSRRGPVSAHERHYALKKAVSDDLKKKTFLPYKQGILGSFHGFGG